MDRTPRPDHRARSNCVREDAAAFEIEQAGIIGNGARAARDTLLTIAPRE